MGYRRCLFAGTLAFVGGLLPVALSAQSYGTTQQVLTVGAASFRGEKLQPVFGADGFLYNPPGMIGGSYSAPLRLPNGAGISRFCAYLRSEEANPSFATVSIRAIRMYPAGPNGTFGGPSVGLYFNSGYSEFCTDVGPPAYLIRNDNDLDSDGNSDHVSYRLSVDLSPGATSGFGGVRIFWNRQVSTPPAQATFGDVSSGHPFFLYIEALSASAITGGCGNGNFCPNGNLTRGQMAVFLAKALGLHWVN